MGENNSGHNNKNDNALFAFFGLALGALGVVYGDIGTSPIYAINEIFFGHGHVLPTPENILGAISLVVWALTLVVTLKYILFVLRADSKGEGGVFALLNILKKSKVKRAVMIGILILAAGLLFGDGIITPSISVLSAVEGLKDINAGFSNFIIPITIAILTLLFMIQKKGTEKIGRIFGPIMLVWFVVIGLLGLSHISVHPEILQALNPLLGLHFIFFMGIFNSMAVLGSVMLVVTGGEALYADLAHFGKKPIRFSWLVLVYPALLLNYFGQGAFLLGGVSGTSSSIFYDMVPKMFLYPMIILATFATIIASQALVSGIFSLTEQAMSLGLSPRLRIKHTSENHEGQIYIGAINWILYACCVELVLVFRTSGSLAAAYGLAVSGVMLATSMAMIPIAAEHWKWPKSLAYSVFGLFAVIDATFLIANTMKFLEGGYIPVFFGLSIFTVMNIWLWGRTLIWDLYDNYTEGRDMAWLCALKKKLTKSDHYLDDGDSHRILVESNRVIVFMSSSYIVSPEDKIPVSMRIYLKRTGSMPKYILLMNIERKKIPYIKEQDRFEVQKFGNNIFSVKVTYGFMEHANVREALLQLNPDLAPDLAKSVIVVDKEQFFIDKSAPWWLKVKAAIFQTTLLLGVRAHKYFGLHSKDGLFEVDMPIHVDKNGANISHPEFDLSYPDET